MKNCLQGLVISLPYCYLNSEVQSVVQSHYTRWQLVRSVGREQAHSHTSITANNSSKGQVGVPHVLPSSAKQPQAPAEAVVVKIVCYMMVYVVLLLQLFVP